MTLAGEPSGTRVGKAVVPAAGLGTRFLPATKAQPKEMLPVVDIPAIQYVVEEAVNAGLDDVLLITGRNKGSIEDHFDRAPELERLLTEKGDIDRLELVERLGGLAKIHSIRQGEPKGLGHAVGCAREHIGAEPFAVLLGDDLIDPETPVLSRMADVRERHGGSVLCLAEVAPEFIGLYGCAAVEQTAEADVVRVRGLVEKPAPGQAPSNLAIVGRYVLDPAIFDALEGVGPGHGGEIQLTDALERLIPRGIDDGGGIHAVVFTGRRFDTGDKLSYLQAVIEVACGRGDLGPALRQWLRDRVAAGLLDEPPRRPGA